MAKIKSKSEVRYLLGKNTPLSGPAKANLMSNLHTGTVRVRSKPVTKPVRFSQATFNRVHNEIYNI